MIQQAYKYVSSSSWPHFNIFRAEITKILKSRGWGVSCHGKIIFFDSNRCVSCRTLYISLESSN